MRNFNPVLLRNILSSVLLIALSMAPLRGEVVSLPPRASDESSLLDRIRYKIAHSRIASSVLRSVSCGLAALFWFQQAHNFGVLSEDESVKGRLLYGLPLLGLTGLSAWNVVRTYDELVDTQAGNEFEALHQIDNVVLSVQKEIEPLSGVTDVELFADALAKNPLIIEPWDSAAVGGRLLRDSVEIIKDYALDPSPDLNAFLLRIQKAKQDIKMLCEKYEIVLEAAQKELIKKIEIISAYVVAHKNEIKNNLIGHLILRELDIFTTMWEPFLRVADDAKLLRCCVLSSSIVCRPNFGVCFPVEDFVLRLDSYIARIQYLKDTYGHHKDLLDKTIDSLKHLKQRIATHLLVDACQERNSFRDLYNKQALSWEWMTTLFFVMYFVAAAARGR